MEIQERYQHKSVFSSSSTEFSAVFNAVIPGRYDFTGTPTCQNLRVFDLQRGTLYQIKKISVSGNLPEYDYLGSIVDFPQLTVSRWKRTEPVYRYSIPINSYYENTDCQAWLKSDQKDDRLLLSLSGSCIQLPTMVGLLTMTLNISLIIFSFSDTQFMSEFEHKII